MSRFIDKYVLCPFFRGIKNNNQTIICEGVQEHSTININFGSKEEMSLFLHKNCCNRYDTCLWATMLLRKYEEEQK